MLCIMRRAQLPWSDNELPASSCINDAAALAPGKVLQNTSSPRRPAPPRLASAEAFAEVVNALDRLAFVLRAPSPSQTPRIVRRVFCPKERSRNHRAPRCRRLDLPSLCRLSRVR